MNYKKHKLKVFIALFIVGVIIIAAYKGCRVYKKTAGDAINYKARLDALLKDSADMADELRLNGDTMAFINGQLELSASREMSFRDSFKVLNGRITYLLARHKPVAPSIDTNITTVPNEYINECEGCYDALASAQQQGLKYKAELDNKDQINASKTNTLNRKIKILETSNAKLSKDYKSVLDSASKHKPQEIRRTLFLSFGGMSINSVLPNAIGAGFMYEDKRRRIYGAKYYISNHGPIYSVDFSIPLSLRFIK